MTIRTTADLAALIRERRRKLNLDQTKLAARVGVSRKWIVNIEKGKARADVSLVLRTLEVLGIELKPLPASTASAPSGTPQATVDSIVEAARRRSR